MAFFSDKSADYTSQIQSLKKPTYTSKYDSQIQKNLNDILNHKKFTYDFNADPLYQMYKDQYSKQGKEAAMDAMAQSAGNTSGYANSYGVSQAAKANQNVLDQLNERVPELYNAAQVRYQNNLNNMYQKFNTLMSEENRLYGIYRDSVGDYYNELSNLQSGYETALTQENFNAEMAYRRERDAIADQQHAEQMAYQRARDQAADAQAAAELAYQRERDAASDAQWQQSYQAALSQAQAIATPAATSAAKTTTAAPAAAKATTTAKSTTSTKSTSTKSTTSTKSNVAAKVNASMASAAINQKYAKQNTALAKHYSK
jgi:AAA+ ATPase superfamily predicted ATPase